MLPVNDIDTGGTVDTYGLDAGKAGAAAAVAVPRRRCRRTRTGDTVRVLVENGVGTPDLVEQARTKLVDDGFQFINGGNAPTFSRPSRASS